jgi:hypothetical protein
MFKINQTKEGVVIGDSFEKVLGIYGAFTDSHINGEIFVVYFDNIVFNFLNNIVISIAYIGEQNVML